MITPHSSPSGVKTPSTRSSESEQRDPPVKAKVLPPNELQVNKNEPSVGGGAQEKLRGVPWTETGLKARSKRVTVAPDSLMTSSMAEHVSVVVPVQLKVSETVTVVSPGVRRTVLHAGCPNPPQPFVKTIGSVPSASAVGAETLKNATISNAATKKMWMSFTIIPRYLETEQPETDLQFCCHMTKLPLIQSTCNCWLYRRTNPIQLLGV